MMPASYEQSSDGNENPQVTPEAALPTRGFSRRRLLQLGIGGTLASTGIGALLQLTKPLPPSVLDGSMADTGLTFSRRSEALRIAEQDVRVRRKKFAATYLTNGDLTGIEEVVTDAEWINYLRATTSDVSGADEFRAKTYDPFMKQVEDSFGMRLKTDDPMRKDDTETFQTPTVAVLADLKIALYENLGDDISYDRSFNSIADPLMHQNLQCRSGTKLYLLAAQRSAKPLLQPGERLVQIHTKGHTLPGLLTADNRVIGFEMTKSGRGIVDFGTMDSLGQSGLEIQVVDAEHGLAQDAIGQKAFHDKTLLADTSKKEVPLPSFGIPGMRKNTDQHGFGSADVPAGRSPIDRADYISPQAMEGGNGIYGSMGASSESRDLLRKLSSEEQIIVRRYMQHSNYFSRCFTRHVKILQQIQDRPSMSLQEAKKIMLVADAVFGEMNDYLEKNRMIEDHKNATLILRQHKLTLNFDTLDIINQMVSNQKKAARIWSRAQAEAELGR